MPINKIVTTKRGKTAIATNMAAAIAGAVVTITSGTPASVKLATDHLI